MWDKGEIKVTLSHKMYGTKAGLKTFRDQQDVGNERAASLTSKAPITNK